MEIGTSLKILRRLVLYKLYTPALIPALQRQTLNCPKRPRQTVFRPLEVQQQVRLISTLHSSR